MSTHSYAEENKLYVSIAKRARIGIVSGLVGGFAIFFMIFIIDFHMGQIPGTFYKTVGFPIGLEGISATLFGMIAHMATAALIGAVFCVCSGLHQKLEISDATRGILAGGITGTVVYLFFFIPITILIMQPLIEQGIHNDLGLIATISNIESVHIIQNMSLIVFGASVVHVLFGVIMGLTTALSLGQESKPTHFSKGRTIRTVTLVIIVGTAVIGIFYGVIANYSSSFTPATQQNELTDELSKLEAGLTYAKFLNMNQDERAALFEQMPQYAKSLIVNEAKKYDKLIHEDMSKITQNLESADNLKFLQSAQISGVKGNNAEGKALIVSNGQTEYLRLEDFSVIPGIDQHIYLTKSGDVSHGIDIGMVKANRGSQNYPISGIDSYEYNHLIIYSKTFDMYYASSALAKIGTN